MKCDELEQVEYPIEFGSYYKKDEVDAAIAELKEKLEDAKATAYAESVDAGMRERRLKRALWLARANRAGHCASVFYFVPSEYLNTPLNIYGYANKDIGMERMLKPRRWMKIWQKVERLCRAKAEEYK